eukprot:3624887-Pleurochrysis_carterae.AAC.4
MLYSTYLSSAISLICIESLGARTLLQMYKLAASPSAYGNSFTGERFQKEPLVTQLNSVCVHDLQTCADFRPYYKPRQEIYTAQVHRNSCSNTHQEAKTPSHALNGGGGMSSSWSRSRMESEFAGKVMKASCAPMQPQYHRTLSWLAA